MDAVCDILHVVDEDIQPPPDVGVAEIRDFIQGLLAAETRIVSLLSLDSILPPLALAA